MKVKVLIDPGLETTITVIRDEVLLSKKTAKLHTALKEFDMYFTSDYIKYKREVILKDTRKTAPDSFEIWMNALNDWKIKYKVMSTKQFKQL